MSGAGTARVRALIRTLRPAHGLPQPTPRGAVTLRARGIDIARGGRPVLESVDIDVVAGQILALVGPNGAGKSTLLAALSGELEPASGTVELDGRPVTDWTPTDMARRRAVLPQNHTVGFPFTVREVVAMGRSPWARTPRQEFDDRVIAAALAATDMEHLAARPFPALSGGERARAALARVLAQDTETLLLDEPTAALDLGHQEQVLRLAAARAGEGAAVVVVLHDLGLAAAYADRVAVLDAGRLAAVGHPREILTTDLLTRVYRHPVEVIDHPVTGAQLVLPVRR
ncbi:heme ABC transporter ATP-binding protein [Nocardia sp. 852002-20019_SCH5090214]|uniref:Heme ABC transporter ATP-binding protein n=1 Tax=Nocardia nova TaxID=37330 RepID=A0A2S6A2F7_9NOCA|nr:MULTISPECIES: heme ABC transporter ATP-binding protein [Nocardia]OBF66573.1 heme ABC transporter ATP-binding protein [Mycobacterium sp. 852002-51759_SCH5129042]MBF6273357.1 heme ABC transporter ATP-binding protein [Nocardia nova]MBV7703395.1 heme ABC transporter ATP-binding protein [Nocardia nova]OBA49391.1 heme ABC transporter ATP-binding protein [Nocardia sp. 852002-51101_SCH5132738]OBA66828.1 heme ABC transporter ATP-binding protein [Nocardia sp. 852002-20019_SCH5090214]